MDLFIIESLRKVNNVKVFRLRLSCSGMCGAMYVICWNIISGFIHLALSLSEHRTQNDVLDSLVWFMDWEDI